MHSSKLNTKILKNQTRNKWTPVSLFMKGRERSRLPYLGIPTTTQNPGPQVACKRRLQKWKLCSSSWMDWIKYSSLHLLEVLRERQGLDLGRQCTRCPPSPRYVGVVSREHAQQAALQNAFNLMFAALVIITALYYWYYYSSFSFCMDLYCSLGDKGGRKNGLQGGLNAV